MKKSRMVDEDLLKTDWAGKNWQNAGGTRRGSGLIGATGKKGFIINLVICLLLLGVIVYIFVSQFAISSKITPSTIQRKKNDTEFVTSGYQYFLDEAGIVSNANNLKRAENNFYKNTGVIPFTYFLTAERVCSKEELEQTARDYYQEHYQDGDHLVVVFSGKGTDCAAGYYVGERASAVIDEEALKIFDDYLKMYYHDRTIDFEPFMVNAYNYSTERIMSTMNFSTKSLIFALVIITFFVYTLFMLMKRR